MSIDQYQEAIAQMERRYNDLQNERDNALAKLQNITDANQTLTEENDHFLRKVTGAQSELNNLRNQQSRLESQLYTQERTIEDLKKESQSAVKSRRELEKKLASELIIFERERTAWQERENELSREIRNLKNSVNGDSTPEGAISPKRRVSVSANGRSSVDSNEDSAKATENHSIQDARTAMKMKAQERLIMDLKSEVDAQKQLAAEHIAQSQRQEAKIAQLENELAQMQQISRSLMEDNESYQILLHEKTMNGEFMMNPIMQQSRFASSSSSLAMAEEDVAAIKKANNASGNPGGGLNLAAELGRVADTQQQGDIEKLTEEIKNQKDENKALTLYISKILLRIMASDSLKDILSIDPPKPDPPKPSPPVVTPSPTPSTGSDSKSRRRRTTISSPISFWGRKNSAEDENSDDLKLKPSVSTSSHGRGASETTATSSPLARSISASSLNPSEPTKKPSTENLAEKLEGKALRRHSSAVGPASGGSFFKRLTWTSRPNPPPAVTEDNSSSTSTPTIITTTSASEESSDQDKLSPNGSTGELRKSGEVQVLGPLGEVAEED